MIRKNVDVIAMVLLLAGMALCSHASKIEICDLFTDKQLIINRGGSGPSISLVSLVPLQLTTCPR
ncbi:MAG: hypothetical protein JO061_00205 [Acidobacteriaceae bacterium]|nr:hypothetical protein [Acidobacteriaceae bacterium]